MTLSSPEDARGSSNRKDKKNEGEKPKDQSQNPLRGAPYRNTYAVGYGRPPKYFNEQEVHELGRNLLAWMKDCDKRKEKIVHLSSWYYEHEELTPSEWGALQERPSFSEYYKRAITWVGVRLLKSDIPAAYVSRFLGIYFKEVREYERAAVEHKVDYELEKKARMDAAVTIDIENSFTQVMDTLKTIQDERRIDSSSINADDKS